MVRSLREQGKNVRTIGVPGSEADAVVEVAGGLRALRLLRHCQGSEQVFLHWHDLFFYYGGVRSRLLTSVALWVLYRCCRQIRVICHETYALPEPPKTWLRRALHSLEVRVRRAVWQAVTIVVFHSPAEREKMEAAASVRLDDHRVEILPHGSFFLKFREVTQTQARAELGTPQDEVIFLCIGFLGESKGFHRALEAFCRIPNDHARLFIVGSALYDSVEVRRYIQRLHQTADRIPRAKVIEKYVTNEEFDTWIAASDYVLAPYENAFSSGVVERAKLFGKPIVASAAGGLPNQLTERDFLFASDAELLSLLRRLALTARG